MRVKRVASVKAFATALMLAIFFAAPTTHAQSAPTEPADQVLILFDQSGSVGRYDPKLVSKAWLLTFIETFNTPHRIIFDGFDEEVRPHIEVSTNNPLDMAELANKIDAIPTKGLATDFETAFRHIRDRGNVDQVRYVLMVSDGIPEIWDPKIPYLSWAVRRDKRYADLTQQYNDLKRDGWTAAQLFKHLSERFHDRNMALIEAHLSHLADTLGDRLIIWDLSARSKYLSRWSKKAGAQYFSSRVTAGKNPAIPLRKALLTLQRKTAEMVQEPLPANHQDQVEKVLSTVIETVPPAKAPKVTSAPVDAKPVAPPPPPSAPTEPDTEVVQKATPPTPPEKPVVATQPEPEQPPSPPVWLILFGIVAAVAITIFLILRRRPKPTQAPAEVVKEAQHRVNDLYEDAIGEAETLRRELLVQSPRQKQPERRLSLRVAVPPGAVRVYWTNADGSHSESDGVNLSMHGVLFVADNFNADGIDKIVFPQRHVEFNLTRVDIMDRDEAHRVAVIHEFENDDDAKMHWVEMLTRVNETM